MEFAFLPISKIVLRKKGIVFPWLGKYPIFRILSLRSIFIIPQFFCFCNRFCNSCKKNKTKSAPTEADAPKNANSDCCHTKLNKHREISIQICQVELAFFKLIIDRKLYGNKAPCKKQRDPLRLVIHFV